MYVRDLINFFVNHDDQLDYIQATYNRGRVCDSDTSADMLYMLLIVK